MTECNNTEVRDLLPDIVAEGLLAGDQAMVDAHLVGCAECRDELALLRVARAVRPRAVDIDVARIVAALPSRAPALQLVKSEGSSRADGASAHDRALAAPPSQRKPALAGRSRTLGTAWKIAAAVGIVAIGSWSAMSVRGAESVTSPNGASVAAAGVPATTVDGAPPSVMVAIGESLDAATGKPDAAARVPAPAPARASALSLGDLSEYSDEELQRVLERLDKWDGATSDDPLPASSIVSRSVRGML